jgi:D-amino-acid dehydrogenase
VHLHEAVLRPSLSDSGNADGVDVSDVNSCVVVGGGVAGLWTSWALTELGVEVTLLEAATTGAGASWGNAGWICPAQAGPVPEPGIMAHGLRDMAKRDSTVHFTPAAAARMGPWIARFARYCNETDYAAGVAALSTLGYPSFKLIEHLGLDEHVDKTGLLAISARREEIEKFVAKIAPLADFGQQVGDILDGEAVQDVDPVVPRGQTAVLVSNHWQIVPHQYNEALRDKVLAAGVTILEDHPVSGFDTAGERVRRVLADRKSFSADAVVLAAGVETTSLVRQLGVKLPVVGGKGYSIDVTPEHMPRQAIDSLDEHLALSPMGRSLRIVGGMEFSTSPQRVSGARVASMRRSAARVVGSWAAESKPWTGLRPVAPDGLPLLGRIRPRSNVFVATGYSMLGMTISPAAGTYLAEAIASGDDGTAGPFSPQRFTRRRLRL